MEHPKDKPYPIPATKIIERDNFVHILPPRCGSKSFMRLATGMFPGEKEQFGIIVDTKEFKDILKNAKKRNVPVIINIREPIQRALSGLSMVFQEPDNHYAWSHCVPFLTHIDIEYVTHIIPFWDFHKFMKEKFVVYGEEKFEKMPRDISMLRDNFDDELIIYNKLKRFPVMQPEEYFRLIGKVHKWS